MAKRQLLATTRGTKESWQRCALIFLNLPQGQGFLKKIATGLVSGLGGARFFSKNLAPGVILGRPLKEALQCPTSLNLKQIKQSLYENARGLSMSGQHRALKFL